MISLYSVVTTRLLLDMRILHFLCFRYSYSGVKLSTSGPFPLYPKIVTDHSFTESLKIASVVLTLSCILPAFESKTKTGELIKRKITGHFFIS